MSDPNDVLARIDEQFGLKRSVLLAVGLSCLALGAVSALLPAELFGSIVKAIGLILIGSGVLKAGQLLLGRKSAEERRRGWPLIVSQVALDLAMGGLLINHRETSVEVVTLLLGLLFVSEGLLLLYMALRSPSRRSLAALVVGGLISATLGVVVMMRWVPDPLAWVGVVVGIKLGAFGATLTWIALQSGRTDSLVYEAAEVVPIVAELYAVYFGTAFHLGVYIGDGRVVHYLDDNHVHEVSWETFLEGRSPEHWTYPDLEPVPAEKVVETALSEVGKTYPYNLLRFNCEHFAIFCKSGGATYQSIYAQVAGGFANLEKHPLIGMVAELNTRLVEWFAFHMGGTYGKRLSLLIRRIGCVIMNRLVDGTSRRNSLPPTTNGPA
ncbi:MAG: lecithin retinol acyltransferase family protein [Isosphaeraceae bacterium]|nr:lecithin retinol acyltransferase family protein [Isosphaeraceae bacterium]